MKKAKIINIIVAVVLLASIGTNIYFVLNSNNYDSMVQYLQTSQQMRIV